MSSSTATSAFAFAVSQDDVFYLDPLWPVAGHCMDCRKRVVYVQKTVSGRGPGLLRCLACAQTSPEPLARAAVLVRLVFSQCTSVLSRSWKPNEWRGILKRPEMQDLSVYVDGEGRTLAHLCAVFADSQALEQVVQKWPGALQVAAPKIGTPLHAAFLGADGSKFRSGEVAQCVRVLVAAKADVNAKVRKID